MGKKDRGTLRQFTEQDLVRPRGWLKVGPGPTFTFLSIDIHFGVFFASTHHQIEGITTTPASHSLLYFFILYSCHVVTHLLCLICCIRIILCSNSPFRSTPYTFVAVACTVSSTLVCIARVIFPMPLTSFNTMSQGRAPRFLLVVISMEPHKRRAMRVLALVGTLNGPTEWKFESCHISPTNDQCTVSSAARGQPHASTKCHF